MVLKYLNVEIRLWKNQNGLGQKFAEVRHYGIQVPLKHIIWSKIVIFLAQNLKNGF